MARLLAWAATGAAVAALLTAAWFLAADTDPAATRGDVVEVCGTVVPFGDPNW